MPSNSFLTIWKISENEQIIRVFADFLNNNSYLWTRKDGDMKYKSIIGRKKEIAELEYRYKTDKSEFLAIYGRRRVGKSFLVTEVYGKRIVFTAVGTYLKDDDRPYESYRQIQLEHFYDSLLVAGMSDEVAKPKNWREAFLLLRKHLEGLKTRRKVILIDELPWLAGPQSAELISELGYFWNSWADKQRNIVLVVCGSATSWMLDNVIHDYGGLHGRLTQTIKLLPFSISECEKYYKSKGFRLSRYEMCVCYMAIGGIPYYLDKLKSDRTLGENLNNLFFSGEMIHQEFRDVYTGLYASKDRYVDIIRILGRHFYGLTQKEISEETGIKSGGTLTALLDNLRESGITREYPRYGKSRVETVYQLKDFFSLFYLRFVEKKTVLAGGWISLQRTPDFYTWAGDTFELFCIEHIESIKTALHLGSIDRNYCWRGKSPEGTGAQIDLILEWNNARTDYLCEMKFSENKFAISASYEEDLQNKISAFQASKMHKNTHSIQLVMVTTFGLTSSAHNRSVNISLSLDDLFV